MSGDSDEVTMKPSKKNLSQEMEAIETVRREALNSPVAFPDENTSNL